MGFIAYYPKTCLAILLGIVLSFIPGLLQLKISDNFVDGYFYEDNPDYINYQKTLQSFGNNSDIILGIHNDKGVLTPKSLEDLSYIAEDIYDLDGVERVTSLATLPFIEGTSDAVTISALDGGKTTAQIKEALQKNPAARNLLSHDQKHGITVVSLKNASVERQEQIISGIAQTLERYNISPDNYRMFGMPILQNAVYRTILETMAFVIPVAMSGMFVLFLFFTRSFVLACLPMLVVTISIAITLGVGGYLGFPITIFSVGISQVILAIGVCDALHLVFTFLHRSENDRFTLVKESLRKNALPTFLTSATTALSFFSFSYSEIRGASEFGILSSIGTLTAWITTFIIMGPAMLWIKRPQLRTRATRDSFYQWAVHIIVRFKIPIVILFSTIAILGLTQGSKIKMGMDVENFFHEEHPVSQSIDYFQSNFTSASHRSFYIECGKAGCVQDKNFLHRVKQFHAFLAKEPYLTSINSPMDSLQSLSEILYPETPFEQLSSGKIDELFTIFDLQSPEENPIAPFVDSSGKTFKFNAFVKEEKMEESRAIDRKIIGQGKEMGLNVRSVSLRALFAKAEGYIIPIIFQSIIITIGGVTIFLFCIFRRLEAVLIALVPNIFTLLSVSLIFYLFDISINASTMVVWCISMGIAVDDTIHFMHHYMDARGRGETRRESVVNVFHETGSALAGTTAVLVAGFGSAILSSYAPSWHAGLLLSAAMVSALVADMVLLPSLLLLRDR